MKFRLKEYLWLGWPLGIVLFLSFNLIFQSAGKKPKTGDDLPEREIVTDEPKRITPAAVSVPGAREAEPCGLELMGTIMGQPSAAFIYDPRTLAGGLYKVNDRLDGFRIAGISPGKVIVEKNGSQQELFLVSRKSSGSAATEESFVSRTDSGIIVISKFRMISRLIRDNEAVSKLKIIPLADSEPDKLKGFRLDNVPAGSVIEDIGFKNGDIIYSVQGQRLENMQDAMAAFNRITSQPRLEVALLRDDQLITLNYELH